MKWINLKDRYPEKAGEYFVITITGLKSVSHLLFDSPTEEQKFNFKHIGRGTVEKWLDETKV